MGNANALDAGARLVPGRMPSKPTQARKRGGQKHGLTTLKRAVKGLGGRVIDRRTSLGKALDQWRANLIADLGGKEEVSTQELAIVNLAVKTKLMLDSIDAWVLTQPSLVNARKRALLPVVRERVQLADALSRYLGQLGLKRRAREAVSLQDYLAKKETGEQEVTTRHEQEAT